MKNSRFRHIFNHIGLAVFTALLFGTIGIYTLLQTHAATASTLTGNQKLTAGNQLVSPSGGVKLKMQTDGNLALRNWQDTVIWTSGSAGKGGTWLILQASDGNLVMYTNGGSAVWAANTAGKGGTKLTVQDDGNVVLYTSGGKAVWATDTNGKQGTAPAPTPTPTPTPAPTPTPTPTPAPTPTTPKTTTPKTTTPKTSAPKTTTPAAPTLSGEADATVTHGTTVATLSIPAGNATSLYVRYGTDADSLDRSSEVQKVSGTTATVQLENLTGKTTYTYQIVRMLDKQTTTSINATFTTNSYTVTLLFTDGSGKPVSGVKVQLGKNKAVTSGKDGKVTFTNVGNGSYSAIFTYAGMSYSEDFTTSSAKENSATGNAVLTDTIDLSKLQKTAQTASKKGQAGTKSSAALPVFLCVLLLLAGGIVWWVIWRKRRREKEAEAYLADYATPMPSPYVSQPAPAVSPEPQAVVTAVAHHKGHRKAHEPAPAPSHMGESLRDMVLQSMAEESAKHPESHSKKPPIVPGG